MDLITRVGKALGKNDKKLILVLTQARPDVSHNPINTYSISFHLFISSIN
jgi:hypothetical protein